MSLEKAKKYLDLAKYNALLFSKDPHTKVGCLLLTPDFSRILSTGINGFPRKFDDDDKDKWKRPEKYHYVCHSELNAIANAARSGTTLDGCVMVVTMFPCADCAKYIIQSGITTIYTPTPNLNDPRWGTIWNYSLEMFKTCDIKIVYLND